MKKLISIIIPAYNSESSVRNCMESIAGQNFRNIEAIVVDGGSKDKTMDIVKEFESRVDFVLRSVTGKDNGIYDAINKGIRMSEGQWIYVLGTDDQLYSPETLARIAPVLQSTKEDIVYGNVKVVGDAGWARDGAVHDGEFPLEKLVQRNICQQAIFYRVSVFRKHGMFNHEYKVCADWDFILRCAASGNLQYTDQIIAWFHGGGTSTSGESNSFYDDFAVNLYEYFGLRIRKKEFQAVAWRFARQAEIERKNGNWWRAFVFGRAGAV